MSVAICGFNVYLYRPPKNPLRKKDRSFSSGMNFWFPSLPKTNRNLGIQTDTCTYRCIHYTVIEGLVDIVFGTVWKIICQFWY